MEMISSAAHFTSPRVASKAPLPVPPQPPKSAWSFINHLKAPLWKDHRWLWREAQENEVDVRNGVWCAAGALSEMEPLGTALADLKAFCAAGKIPWQQGYEIELCQVSGDKEEVGFEIEIGADKGRILAVTAHGLQQGIFEMERMMQRAGGPFLQLGRISRKFRMKTRLSRCFFGPIKRPPLNRDELTDDVDYYPDEYLNKLAHDGVNALWISINLHDLCTSPLFPQHGADAARRLEKLRRTIAACGRYGIRVFAFTIEPKSFGAAPEQKPIADLLRQPNLGGREWGNSVLFCTEADGSLHYLEDAFRQLFLGAPGLGGIVNITYGERPTHCFCSAEGLSRNPCPRCGLVAAADGVSRILKAIKKGVHTVDRSAEVIAWFYVPQIREILDNQPTEICRVLSEVAKKVPFGVSLQVNFESLGEEIQLGKAREVLDYSLAHIGPSHFFETCARNVTAGKGEMSAKIQVACSHEVATVPFVPVPGNLFHKYQKMRALGVTSVMQSWYFGNYPCMMTRAAGILSQEPFPPSEDAFLKTLAQEEWRAEHVPLVVECWKRFAKAYGHFPANLLFSHYGPVHDSISWLLHLLPVDTPLAPSWKLEFPISGDRIGECIGYGHELEEILRLMEKVCDGWHESWMLMKSLITHYKDAPDRLRDLGVAEALNLQFHSAYRVLKFYSLREGLPWQASSQQRDALCTMKEIVKHEIAASFRLAQLAKADSRLGFHSEAEGYKYFPAKLRWRAKRLVQLLRHDFPVVEELIDRGAPVFPHYSGKKPIGPTYHSAKVAIPTTEELPWPLARKEIVTGRGGFAWQALHSCEDLFIRVICNGTPEVVESEDFFSQEHLILLIEPKRLWPTHRFHVNATGQTFHDNRGTHEDRRWTAHTRLQENRWEATFTIPLECLRSHLPAHRPMRINIQRYLDQGASTAWIDPTPLPNRLYYGPENPADLGWLLFEHSSHNAMNQSPHKDSCSS